MTPIRLRLFSVLFLFFTLLVSGLTTQAQTSFTVTNTNDAGAGSLRQAFDDIRLSTDPGPFTVTFGVSGTVNVASTLVAPNKDILLLGYSTNPADVVLDGGGSSSDYTILNLSNPVRFEIQYISFANARTNSAAASGGAIGVGGGHLVARFCQFYQNSATNFGGAIYHGAGSFTITNSTFASNTALSNGGAIQKSSTNPGLIDNCTFSGNVGRAGGAIEAAIGSLTINNSTFTQNQAVGNPSPTGAAGGAIFGGNGAAVVTLNNCLIVGNTTLGTGPDLRSGFSSDLGYNLIGSTGGATIGGTTTGTITGVSAGAVLFPTLALNGGTTPTHAIQASGSAYNAGPPASTDADQRGLAVFGGRRDIGAFESQTIAPPTLSGVTDCATNSATLTANCAVGTVLWNTNATTTTLVVSTAATTVYSASCVASFTSAGSSFTVVNIPNSFTVTNTADSGPGSLREAITTANANPDCGPFRITLPANQTVSLTAALPNITFSGTIAGESSLCPATGVGGSTIIRTGSAEFRLLNQTAGSLLIRDLVLQNGDAAPDADVGGAIKTANASLTVIQCLFRQNTGGQGGAIANYTSTLFIDQTLFDDNTGALGSALFNSLGGTTQLTRSTIRQQTSNSNSLIDNLAGSVRVENCTFSSSAANGQAIRLNGLVGAASLSVVHSTFQIPNTTFGINAVRYTTPQSLYLQNNVFGPVTRQPLFFDGSEGSLAVTSGGGNVFAGDATAGNNANGTYTPAPTDKNNVGATGLALGSLTALSGECIPTIPLGCFSQAIDAAVSSGVTADARGITQVGAARDAGAYESSPASITFTVVSSATGCEGESVTLTASGCTGGTVNWPDGITGNVFSTSMAGTYTATCTIGTCSTTVSGTVSSIHPDYQALVDLYNSTNGPNWRNKTGWLQGCDPCTGNAGNPWYGLLCSAGRVRHIEMPENQLSGNLPASLSALTNLDFLDLKGNQLTGSIPASLSTLTSLQRLILNNNLLSGSIPASLSAITSLRFLILERNQLTGNIPASLSALSNLETLRLQNNRLTGSIPASLSAMTGLIEIQFGNNELSGPIPAGLSALTNLKFLYLQNNQLSGPIPASFSALTRLTQFYGFNNQLSGCYPASLTVFCGIMKSFANNAGLPGGGSDAAFTAFCNTGTGSDAFVASATASSSTAFVGSSVSLSTSGGDFGTPGSYNWTAPPGAILSSPPTASVVSATLTSTGEQIFTVVVSFGGSCTHTATVGVTGVVPPPCGAAPTLSASSSVVCAGGNVLVVASGSGSSPMQWYKDGQPTGQFTATLALGGVQVAQAGSYVLAVPGACSVTSAPFNLTVNPLPVVTLTLPQGATVVGPGSGVATITLPAPLTGVAMQVFGGVSFERLIIIDRINGFEIRQVDSNGNGVFPINRLGPFRLTVTDGNGCQRMVEGTVRTQ